MEATASVSKLLLQLISSAIQRCRLAEDLCRLSILLDRSTCNDPPITCISIADTGIGSNMEEFQDLRCPREFNGAKIWDGALSVRTTCFPDDKVYYYHINLDESISSKRLKRQDSRTKNGAKFSGTEVSLSVPGSPDALVAPIISFLQKIVVLQIPNVTMDLVVKQGASLDTQTQYVFVVNDDKSPCFTDSNLERLKSGFENYVLRHGSCWDIICDQCFIERENLKVGSGTVCAEENHKRAGGTMEVVIIISDLFETTSLCSKSGDGKTEVLYFENFLPSLIPQVALTGLKKVDWKSYGLILANVNDQDGKVNLEWENLPSCVQIEVALHWYHNQYPTRQNFQPGTNLVRKGIKIALDDLKAKHEGFLLSAHARKICSHVPDLARSIAGLILSSTDMDFQGDCLSILGIQPQEVEREAVEDYIQRKIIVAIRINERKPQKDQDAAPFLFFDGESGASYFEDDEMEGEYYSTSLE